MLGVAPEYSRKRLLLLLPAPPTVCVFHTETLCVCHRDTVWVSHRDTVCLSHRDTVWCLYSRYLVSIQHIYMLCIYKNDSFWTKIKEFGPNQVHMAPFEVILKQNGSYRVWEASGMPPGL